MTVGCTVRTAEGQQVCVCERQIVSMVHSGGAKESPRGCKSGRGVRAGDAAC